MSYGHVVYWNHMEGGEETLCDKYLDCNVIRAKIISFQKLYAEILKKNERNASWDEKPSCFIRNNKKSLKASTLRKKELESSNLENHSGF